MANLQAIQSNVVEDEPVEKRTTSALLRGADWRDHVGKSTYTLNVAEQTSLLKIIPAVRSAMKQALATVIANHASDLRDMVILRPTGYNITSITGDLDDRPLPVKLENAAPRFDEAPHVEIPTPDDIKKYSLIPTQAEPQAAPSESQTAEAPFSLIAPNAEDLKVFGGNKMASIMDKPRAGIAQTIIRIAQTNERVEWYMNKANEHLYHFSNMAMLDAHSASIALQDVSECCEIATELLATFMRGNERFVFEKDIDCPHDAAASRIIADRIESALQQYLTMAIKNRTEMACANMPQEGTAEYDERVEEVDDSVSKYLQRVSDLINESRLPHKPTPTIAR
jgi:hypothetical protein